MLVDKWRMELIEIVLSIFTVYLYSIYFNIFFSKTQAKYICDNRSWNSCDMATRYSGNCR